MAFPSPRAICVAASGKRVVILHAFVKKTQKTPKQIQALIKKDVHR
ncbi:type II toxin-antitoxin system RelE/ParE family toxin [Acidithiobacillus sp.]